MKLKKIYVGIGISMLAIIGAFSFHSGKVNANPQGFYQSFLSGNQATTSVVYMTPGTATSTLYWDAGLGGASAQGSESAALTVFFNASSSVSTLQVNQEFAQGTSGINCATTPAQCDWYQGTQLDYNNLSTTTQISGGVGVDIAGIPQLSWKFASSTIGGQALVATSNTDSRLIEVHTPTRYSRFVFTLKIIGNGNGSVWAGIVAKKQNP